MQRPLLERIEESIDGYENILIDIMLRKVDCPGELLLKTYRILVETRFMILEWDNGKSRTEKSDPESR